MPADINVDLLTNVSGTGVFDKLMVSINDNINTQFENNRITGSDYATVYLGSMQAAMAQSVQFVLQEQLVEVQIDAGTADIGVKERLTVSEILLQTEQIALAKVQSDKEYAAMLAFIDKEMGFSYTLDVDDNLVRSSLADTADGKLDFEVTNTQKQGVLLDTEEQLKQYQVDSILPTELKLLEQKVVGKKQAEVIGE